MNNENKDKNVLESYTENGNKYDTVKPTKHVIDIMNKIVINDSNNNKKNKL